jgi:hypothetical protein
MSDWIKTTEDIPLEVEPVLVYSKNRYGGYVKSVAILYDGIWKSNETNEKLLNKPTHWQDLPDSPKI